MIKSVKQCRGCGTPFAAPIVNYGLTPIADMLAENANNTKFQAPLALHLCEQCYLLQLSCHLDAKHIFDQNYPYFSSSINSLVERMQHLAVQLVKRYQLDKDSQIIEIASNDGYLLQHFQAQGINVVGIEPSERQAAISNEKNITTECVFFNSESSNELLNKHGAADLIVANNVVAHIADVNDFLTGIELLLKESGTAVFEFHYAAKMLAECQFDTLYHQHIFYYTLGSFQQLVENANMTVNHVEQISSYGGSLRVHVGKQSVTDSSVDKFLKQEHTSGLSQISIYVDFAANAKRCSDELKRQVNQLNKQGKSIVGYGAAAKATTLLSVCGIADQLDYIVDKNTKKHGYYMPGSALQIKPVEYLKKDLPDYILILAWNYADEIKQQLDWFTEQGGRLIVGSLSAEVL